MFDFKVVTLDSNTITNGVQVFAKAMNFSLDVEITVLADAKLFMSYDNLIAIGLQYKDTIVAFGSLIKMNGPSAWIPYVGVEPAYQGFGAGTLLLEHLLSVAKSNNFKSVELVASHAGFPLYKKFGFRSDYPVSHYEIKSAKSSAITQSLEVIALPNDKLLPSWVLQFDKKHLGIDRSNIFPIHSFDTLTLICQKDHGYGILYGQKLGPIVCDSIELARDIIIEGFNQGATSLTLPIDQERLSFFNEKLEISILPNRDGFKMTYGDAISSNQNNIFALRSMAFG